MPIWGKVEVVVLTSSRVDGMRRGEESRSMKKRNIKREKIKEEETEEEKLVWKIQVGMNEMN